MLEYSSKTSTLPAALSDFQQKSEEAIEYVRANSISGQKARDRITVEDRRPKIQLSLKYNSKTKTLSVVVHKIKNLVRSFFSFSFFARGLHSSVVSMLLPKSSPQVRFAAIPKFYWRIMRLLWQCCWSQTGQQILKNKNILILVKPLENGFL